MAGPRGNLGKYLGLYRFQPGEWFVSVNGLRKAFTTEALAEAALKEFAALKGVTAFELLLRPGYAVEKK